MKLLIAIICTLFYSCASTASEMRVPASTDLADPVIHLISTTDLHGYLLAQKNSIGQMTGGVDVMNGYFQIAKKADPDTVLVDSGDLFQGTIVSNKSEGSTVIQWMNYAGYTAAAVGNHDFDFGPGKGFNSVREPGQDPLGALKARELEAKFKFLSANICSVDEDEQKCTDQEHYTPANFVTPYIIKNVHGIRVGIIGLTTPGTPETTLASNVAELRFMPLKTALERYVPEMKTAGADTIVVVMHDGGFCNGGKCNATDPVFKMIDDLRPAVRAAIPLVLAGHTHSYVNTIYNGVHVMITGSYGKSFGYSTLQFHDGVPTVDTKSVDFCAIQLSDSHTCGFGKGEPAPAVFLGQTVQPDPHALELIAKDVDAAEKIASQIVGKLLTPLTKDGAEASLGDFMADSFRFCQSAACNQPSDISFQNNGGIRVSKIEAGPVTYGQIFQLDPFDNYYSVLNLTGRQVHDLISIWYTREKQVIQVSGLKVTYSVSSTQKRSVTDGLGATITVDDSITAIQDSTGKPLDEAKTYRVIMADFLATGGSGSAGVVKGLTPEIHYERNLRDVLVDYLKANPQGLDYSKGEKRIFPTP